jgi:hypothetical protein
LTVYQDLIQRFGDPSKNPEAKKKWKVWLNDANNRAFRTGGGHI